MKNIKKKMVFFLLVALGVLTMFLFGCGSAKYKVDYLGEKNNYVGAKDSYRAGETVTLYYDFIATDTSYSFYLDDESINYQYSEEKGFEITFVMPSHDVKLSCVAVNDMIYEPAMPTEEPAACYMVYGDDSDVDTENSAYIQVMNLTDNLLYYKIINNSTEEIWYGRDFSIQQLADGEYVDLQPKEEICWTEEAILLESGKSIILTCNLDYYEKLTPGQYRLCKNPGLAGKFEICIEEIGN